MKKIAFGLILALVTAAGAQETKMKITKPAKKGPASVMSAPSTAEAGTTNTSISEILSGMQPEATNEALALSNYFPSKGKKIFRATPYFSTGSFSFNTQKGSQSVQSAATLTEVNFQTRISQDWALEFYNVFGIENRSSSYRSSSSFSVTKSDSRQSGLGDFHMIAKTLSQQGSSNLILGADLGLSPAAEEIGSASNDGNRMSGGVQLAPFLSYEQPYKNRVIGWKGIANLKSERAVEYREKGVAALKMTKNGGNLLSGMAFNEWQSRSNVVGLSVRVDLVTEENLEISGRSIQTLDPYQTVSLSLYGQRALNKSVMLLPSLSFSSQINKGTSNVDSFDSLTLGMGARIAL